MSAIHHKQQSAQQPPARRPLAAADVLLVLLVGFALAALLNAASLKRTAETMPYGPRRDAALLVADPLRAVSGAFGFTEPARFVNRLLGRPAEESAGALAREGLSGTEPGAPPDAGASPGATHPITTNRPLVLYIAGDSMMQVFGESLVAASQASGLVDPTLDYHISSGLVRPDFFDWPDRLRLQVNRLQPDAAVVMFGANDTQDMRDDGALLKQETQQWVATYRERVAEVMDLLTAAGCRVYWVGQPIMRLDLYRRHIAIVNRVYLQEAAAHPGVTFIDAWALFTDADGHYTSYLRDESGKLVQMRAGDGIHLTRDGGNRLAGAVLEVIAADWEFER